MLEIIRFNEDEYDFPCLLVLGCFDGLHLGHFELLKKAKLQAKINGLDLGVMMFANGKDAKDGKQLYTFEERLKFLESFNVKFVLRIDYTEEFKKIKPLEFLAILEDKLNVKAYMSGKDFRFGQGAKGKSSTLKSYAEDEDNGVWFMPVKDFVIEEEKVSTTHIKALLDEGDVKKASRLLGRNFAVCGTVIHGADRGAKVVGFPTMNVTYPENKHEVKYGVYTVRCGIGEECLYGIANYGSRPTFDEETPVLEVYLDGLEGEHYDEIITVEFLSYIRDIQKFDSTEELTAQIRKDLELAKEEAAIAEAEREAAGAEVHHVIPATTEAKETTPAPAQPEAVEEQPAEVVSETVEEQPAEVEPETVEEQPAEAEPETVEEQPAEVEPETVEEQPAEVEPEAVEEQPAEVEPETVEEQPAEVESEAVKEQPAEVEPETVEEQPAEVEPEAVEEQPAEVEPEAVEEQPAEVVPETVEEQTEVQTVVEEKTAEVSQETLTEETPATPEAEESAPVTEDTPVPEKPKRKPRKKKTTASEEKPEEKSEENSEEVVSD